MPISIRLALALILFASPALAGKRVVVLDPGHGGREPGAYWGGIKEKSLTLPMALKIELALEKKGIPAILTRRKDVTVSHDSRAAVANKFPDSIFVSIHFNGSTNTSITGIETFYHSDRGKKLATYVQNELAGRIKTKNRGIKRKTNFAVLRKTKGVAILVELGFISNSWERNRSKQGWLQDIMAEEVAQGIAKYYKATTTGAAKYVKN
ncbi:MAG: N-acetylmuramoyl-L-alanine amidase [Verrucomicrobiota bacterium]